MNLIEMQRQATGALMTTGLVEAIARGNVKCNQYCAYLIDVYHYATHSSQVISMAGSRLVLSHPALAAYLFAHAGEELGHEEWAASDLHELGMTNAEITTSLPSDACLQMIGLEYLYAAHLNPIGLFGWMFVLESLGGKVGGGIADALDVALELEGKALYFLRGHAEADINHSEDLVRVISENVSRPADQAVFERMVDLSLSRYIRIIDHAEAVGASDRPALKVVS